MHRLQFVPDRPSPSSSSTARPSPAKQVIALRDISSTAKRFDVMLHIVVQVVQVSHRERTLLQLLAPNFRNAMRYNPKRSSSCKYRRDHASPRRMKGVHIFVTFGISSCILEAAPTASHSPLSYSLINIARPLTRKKYNYLPERSVVVNLAMICEVDSNDAAFYIVFVFRLTHREGDPLVRSDGRSRSLIGICRRSCRRIPRGHRSGLDVNKLAY